MSSFQSSNFSFDMRQFCEFAGISQRLFRKLRAARKGPRMFQMGRKLMIELPVAEDWIALRSQRNRMVDIIQVDIIQDMLFEIWVASPDPEKVRQLARIAFHKCDEARLNAVEAVRSKPG